MDMIHFSLIQHGWMKSSRQRYRPSHLILNENIIFDRAQRQFRHGRYNRDHETSNSLYSVSFYGYSRLAFRAVGGVNTSWLATPRVDSISCVGAWSTDDFWIFRTPHNTGTRCRHAKKVDVPAPASFWTGMAGYCPHAFASTGTDSTYNRQSRRRRHSDRDDSP